MRVISFDIEKALHITICDLYSGIELTSSVHFSSSVTHCIPPSQQLSIGITTEANSGIDFKHRILKGALLYKLRRKHTNMTTVLIIILHLSKIL
jgi:hypothetical protein